MLKAKFLLPLLFVGLLLTAPASAQDPTVLQIQSESKLWVVGGSTRHDWTVNASEVQGTVTVHEAEGMMAVDEVQFTVPSEKLESTRDSWSQRKIMNGLMHDALKTEEHPEIVFALTSAEPADPPADNPDAFMLLTRGNLTLAGVTKEIEMQVQGETLDNGQIRFTGNHELLMRDYGVTPPRVKLPGLTLTTHNEVVVHFELLTAEGDGGTQ